MITELILIRSFSLLDSLSSLRVFRWPLHVSIVPDTCLYSYECYGAIFGTCSKTSICAFVLGSGKVLGSLQSLMPFIVTVLPDDWTQQIQAL